jgi:glycosyltransferase involved in cell wall biosynthesis
MRVLQLNARYDGGGAERCGRELFQYLPQAGVETDLWVCQRSPSTPPSVRTLPMFWEEPTVRTLGRIKLLQRPRPAGQTSTSSPVISPTDRAHGIATAVAKWTNQRHIGFRRRVSQIKPGDFDLVHLHATYSGCASLKSLHRLSRIVPLVWTLHDTWAVTGGVLHDLSDSMSASEVAGMTRRAAQPRAARLYHPAFMPPGERDFIRSWMPRPVVALAPSRALTEKARRSDLLNAVEIEHIPNPTVLLDHPIAQHSRAQARQQLGLSPDRPIVLMIASDLTIAHKGLLLGLEALNGLSDPLPQLVLMGDINSVDFPRRAYRGPILTTWARNTRELGRAYRAADVTLIPSLTENLPYTALESLACQTPIAAFRVGGMPDIVAEDRGGLLALPYEIPSLSACLSQLLTDQALNQRLARNGQHWVNQHCCMQDYLLRMKAIYQTAIRLHNGSTGSTRVARSFERAA